MRYDFITQPGEKQLEENIINRFIETMILEIARIESGTTALQLKAEDINTLFHTVNTVFEEDIRKKNLKYSADLDVYHTFIFSFIEMSFCFFPYFWFADVFRSVVRIPFGKMIGYVFLHTENLQAVLCKCDTVFEFFNRLVRSYDQMTFGDCELTYTCQAVHFSGILITEQSGCFTVTKRQITVAVLFCLVYIVLERVCHRTKCKYFFVCLFITENEHTIFVMIPVTGKQLMLLRIG